MKKKSNEPKSPEVCCAHTKMVDAEDLKPHPQNPNTHPEGQLNLLEKIIRQTGWRNPVVVSKQTGYIVKGHARAAVAKKNGWPVPVDVQSYKTPASEIADMLADNRIAELADLNLSMVKDLVAELDTGDFDLDLTGFSAPELERLMSYDAIPQGNKPIDEEAMSNTKNECPKCGFKW